MSEIAQAMAEMTARDRGAYWESRVRGLDLMSYPFAVIDSLKSVSAFEFTGEGITAATFTRAFMTASSGGNSGATNNGVGPEESKGVYRINSGTFSDIYAWARIMDPEIPDGMSWDRVASDVYWSLHVGAMTTLYFREEPLMRIPDPLANGVTLEALLQVSDDPYVATRRSWFLTACAMLQTESIHDMIRMAVDTMDACTSFVLLQ